MATITILSREVVVNINTSWIFYISEVDAAAIIADHYSFTLTLLSGAIVHPSLPSAPWSELYSGLFMDLFGSGWNVTDNGSGDWSINFLVGVGNPNFTNIGDWYNFEVNATTPITPTTGGNQIKLYWNGATDDTGISGYQLQWRTSTTVPWSPVISITHDANYSGNTSQTGGGSYSHSATQLVDHFFRIRIVDSSGQYSSEYKYITASVDANVILISKIGSNFSTFVCTANPLTPEDQVLLSPLPQNLIVANVTYVKNTNNTTFNGSGKYWRILLSGAQYACKVELDGLITEVIDCELEGLGTVYHTEDISSTGVTTVVTNGSVCDLILVNSIYFTGVLGVGTIIYRQVDDAGVLSDPFPGANKFYVVGSSIVKITSNPLGKVLSIQDYSTSCPPVSTCCFVKGTKISMFDNTNKNIEDVKIGDIVITYNEKTKLQEPGEVFKVVSPMRSDIVEYELSNGISIKSTTCHPYWVVNKGWSSFNPLLTKKLYDFDVEQIEENDILLSIDYIEVIIERITELITKEVITYNLGIMGNHTYYANGILVHNKANEPEKFEADGETLTTAWITWNSSQYSQTECIAAAP